ncbi:hypothetical protein PSAB6_450177 [Paraburkholderia sabiae]|uniref:hypothetical protein n=1 Tax=Paraburkholderia sabiae TaxID=273251 RepID=UPI001CB28DA3|nr:hypothetical protein [Paraburkholderia sabiae]CAG9225986.1 hypothetical protein PSAB6_450177 [Paraburkholderia sabiae]
MQINCKPDYSSEIDGLLAQLKSFTERFKVGRRASDLSSAGQHEKRRYRRAPFVLFESPVFEQTISVREHQSDTPAAHNKSGHERVLLQPNSKQSACDIQKRKGDQRLLVEEISSGRIFEVTPLTTVELATHDWKRQSDDFTNWYVVFHARSRFRLACRPQVLRRVTIRLRSLGFAEVKRSIDDYCDAFMRRMIVPWDAMKAESLRACLPYSYIWTEIHVRLRPIGG